MKFCLILGTRPEIIKLSSIIRYLKAKRKNFFIIHSNQHYSANMDRVFFEELELPKTKYNLHVGSGTHAKQTGQMMIKIEKILTKEKPDVVLVQGDTNTVLAGGLTAAKIQIPVAHIEAGLRSYDNSMPEEINRIVVDHLSTFLFAPAKRQKEILAKEGIDKEKIFVVGNTIVDAVLQNKELAQKKSKTLNKLKIQPKTYFLLTLHRPSNVDNKRTFQNIISALNKIISKFKMPIIFPIHPRTQARIEEFKLSLSQDIITLPPVGFLDFLQLENNARLILTDSGGIQEEACILKVPCVTIRENTERPETIEVGANILAGTKTKKILQAVTKMLNKKAKWRNPLGDGKSGERIIKTLSSKK